MPEPTHTPWPGSEPPSQAELESLLREEGLAPRWWSNGPGDRYGAHSHGYHKVLYCARGSIRFQLDGGRAIDLAPGDRLDIPPGVTHSAIVGPRGVACVEAPRG
ncbi:MAG: AraC family ligand binding domain-containing protein [Dehalococcoidia bacterium]